MFDKYVKASLDADEVHANMGEFEAAGMPGTCASISDATHIVHELARGS